MILGRRRTLEL